jgi:hypothetical protein
MENNWILLLVSGVFAVIMILGGLWQSRSRAASRLEAALEAYAAREIASAAQRKKTQHANVFANSGNSRAFQRVRRSES